MRCLCRSKLQRLDGLLSDISAVFALVIAYANPGESERARIFPLAGSAQTERATGGALFTGSARQFAFECC